MKARHEVLEFSDSRVLLTRLRLAAHGDGADPKSFALLLDRAAASKPEAWIQEGFATFTAYVTAPAPSGLEMTREQVKTAAALAGPVTVKLVTGLLAKEQEPERPVGRPRSGEENSRGTRINTVGFSDTTERVVARLKRDADTDPAAAELAAKVISGEYRPDKAAREMGWRKPRIVLAKPETVAKALIEHMPRDALQYIADELTDHLKEN